MTIYEIKERTKKTAPHFFDHKTMKFFNQVLTDFSVTKQGDKFLISAPSYWDGKLMGNTERLFNPETNRLEHISKY